MNEYRIESDSIGEKNVPKTAYYGVQTLRAYENFNITGRAIPRCLIVALAQIKKACAITNMQDNKLSLEIGNAIIKACDDIIDNKYHDQFIVDSVQGGAGTSANMNANEVIANIALEYLGKEKGEYTFCHPNDHVNQAQSTNDVFPTSLKIALYDKGKQVSVKLEELSQALTLKAVEFKDVIKIGRTQLMDAVPITLGQEFQAYATAVQRSKRLLDTSLLELLYINMGATAVGTGINTSEYFHKHIVEQISAVTNLNFMRSYDMIDGTQHIDVFSVVSSSLKVTAISLSKMSNDIRLMNSGPKTGLGEITIPAKQNGSSIMPAKVNPVIPEVVSQACFAVIGNDVAVTMACEAGQLELNAFEPIVFNRIYESMSMLVNAIDTFIHNCVVDIVANKERCHDLLYHSTGFVTALCPILGYKASAEIAKKFLNEGVPIAVGALEYGITQEQLDELLNPDKLARQFELK